jgi:nitroreductase
MTPPQDARAKAQEILEARLAAQLNSEPFSLEDAIAAALEAYGESKRQAALKDAAEVCDRERVRQINGDRFEKLNGQDTAFCLMQNILALAGKEKA